MGVEWTSVSWPLTGGLQTKKSPLAVAPGSHISLVNVRQERFNEWKPRSGSTHDVNDDLPSMPVREIGLPGGGRLAMTNEIGTLPAALLYESGAAASRWQRMDSANCGQSTPSIWNRSPVGATDAPVQVDYCEGSVYSLTAWAGVIGSSLGLFVRIQNKADGTTLPNSATWPTGLISATGIRPRCIAVNNRLWLVYVETSTNTIVAQAWSDTTGAPSNINVVQPNNVNAIHFMDALSYSFGTITVVFRDSASSQVRFQEFNSSTGANTVNVLTAINADVALSLCPDPDLSGVRFMMISNTFPSTTMVRLDNAGTVLTSELCELTQSSNVTGCGYAAGAGWMALYGGGGAVKSVKKVAGVVGAPMSLVTTGPYKIESVAWRQAGTDAMRFMLGIHGNFNDPQDSYFEMALPYATGSSVGVNAFPEPQARLLPLQAGPGPDAVSPGHLVHVSAASSGFVCALLRQGRYGVAAGASASQFAIDRWSVQYMSGFVFPPPNLGQGTATNAAAFLPAGQLLTSAGAQLVGHGLSAIPIKPTTTPGAGGGLTASSTYGHQVVVEVPNENGDVWRSPPSTPTVTVLAAGQTQISVAVVISGLELSNRIVTVKIYRTLSNGSVFRLVNARTGKASALQSFTFIDQVSDPTLLTGDLYFGEVPATITPAFSHTAIFGNRMYGLERDFPNLWMSKPLQKGLQPEFPGVTPWVVSLADEKGVGTALYALDDKLMVHKPTAIYAVAGDGPDNAGGGSPVSVTRIDSDVGSVAGTPVVSTGAEAFFVSSRGIQRVDRSAQIDFVGAGVDVYLNQPSLGGFTYVVAGGVFSSKANEVRFLAMTSFGGQFVALVYNRTNAIWYVDQGAGIGVSSSGNLMSRIAADGREIRYTNAGTMSFEGPPSAIDDGGTPFSSTIGSAWIQAAGPQGRFRLRRARALGATTTFLGGSVTPVMTVLWNFDETGSISPVSEHGSPSAPLADVNSTVRAELAPRNQKCTAFRLQLTLPTGFTTFRLEQWGAVVGIKRGPQKLTTAERWT